MNMEDIVRVGKVTAVNTSKHIAKVWFDALKIESGWMPVLINRDYLPGYGTAQRTEYEQGGTGSAAFESHKHDITIKPYMPMINDMVLVLYVPVFNGDGIILGGVQPWR